MDEAQPASSLNLGAMDNDVEISLLAQLVMARGPGGQEDEVRSICIKKLRCHCDESWIDAAGNVIGLIKGHCITNKPNHSVSLVAHMDEIAMVVKRVEPDGTLRVVALGGANPANFGVCPVDIFGDKHTLPGVLSFGSMHATEDASQGPDVLSGDVRWKDVHVMTRCSVDTLRHHGVRPGSRVTLSRHWRAPFQVGDAIAAHFLDDRAPVAALLIAAADVKRRQTELSSDVYFVFSTLEEESNAGAMYAASNLPAETIIAVEVGPVLAEYATQLSVHPIISAGDQKGYYSRSVVTDLASAAERSGFTPQFALYLDFASDASAAMSMGLTARAGCVSIPTENTHGFEVVLKGAIQACASTLVEYVVGL